MTLSEILFVLCIITAVLYAVYQIIRAILGWLSVISDMVLSLFRQSDWHKYLRGEYLPLDRWRKQHNIYLRSKHWQNFSIRIRLERKSCEVKGCFVSGIKNLQVHHLHYNSLGHEQGKDVNVLCDKHHGYTHAGKTLNLQNGKQLPPFGR